jgi:hypothetical protein
VRTRSPSLVPDEQPYDVAVYIVVNDYGQQLELGRAYAETNEAKADEKTIVSDIISGQYSNPVRVVAFNTVEGWSRDVTEDIARAVLEREASEAEVSESAKKFVERVRGYAAKREQATADLLSRWLGASP